MVFNYSIYLCIAFKFII